MRAVLERIKELDISKITIYFLSVHIIALIFLSIFRLILLIACQDFYQNDEDLVGKFQQVFIRGFKFDNLVIAYISITPFLILSIKSFFTSLSKKILKLTNIYFIVVYTFVFAITLMDIPYFTYFIKHLDLSILNWADFGGTAYLMVITEKTYWIYFIVFFLSVITFSFILSKIARLITKKIKPFSKASISKYNYVMIVLMLIFYCYGIRGNLWHKDTLKLANAGFCESSIFNQAPISPVFFLLNSIQPKSEYIMDQDEAISIAEKQLGFKIKDGQYHKLRTISHPDSLSQRPNIVLIFVESFSSDYLQIEYNNKPLTPHINQLIEKSYYFDRFFSQGVHTSQGLVATLYGFPAMLDYHVFRSAVMNKISREVISHTGIEQESTVAKYRGLPHDLKQYNYQTMFFMTHATSFDMMGNFLYTNGFNPNEVYSQSDYPKEEVTSSWGISDYKLFDHVLDKLDERNKDKPFFVSALTISNHPPYSYPEEFRKLGKNDGECAIAYADYCIGHFMSEASTKDWYNNTIFFIFGDHGKSVGGNELSLNHVPLLIHSRLFEDTPRKINNLAGQIDIYPTIMGMLGIPCTYNSFGVDLLKDKRDYIYFSADDKINCITDQYAYIYNFSLKNESLHTYDTNLQINSNILTGNESIADSLKNLSFGMIEAARYIFQDERNE